MIIKTSHFDNKLFTDLKQLIVNKSSTFRVMGSYKIKEFGSYISDIDIQTNVIYNQTLFNILINKIEKSRSFIFIHMSLGFKKEYALPWKIDNFGGCDYDPEIVKEWYKNFRKMNLVPDSVYTYIENKLFSDSISIKCLIDVENELHQYSEIIWTLDDIKRGYIYFLNTKYTLLDMLQFEQPVLEFIYKYEGDFCLIDLALLDNRYKYEFEQDMYKYYTQDWYKILKFFRWYIKKEYQNEYLETMKKIDLLMAIYNKIILIEKVYKYRLVSQKEFLYIENDIRINLLNTNINFDDHAKNSIKFAVNKYLESYVEYFKNKLNTNIPDKFVSQNKRGIEAQLLVTKEIITRRVKNGVKCPFFKTDIDEYKQFMDITNKLSLDLEKTIDCFVKISEETGKRMKDLLEIAEDAMKSNNIL
jgi:hypothetical protein